MRVNVTSTTQSPIGQLTANHKGDWSGGCVLVRLIGQPGGGDEGGETLGSVVGSSDGNKMRDRVTLCLEGEKCYQGEKESVEFVFQRGNETGT